MILRRNYERSLWETGVPEIYQLAGINPKELTKLVESGYDKLLSVAEASAMEVDSSAGRRAPFGTRLVASARRILGQALSLEVDHDSNQGRVTINITRKASSWPTLSSSSNDVRVPDSEHVSYTLIAFTKQQTKDDTQKINSLQSDSVHGLHLYRKINEPCVVELPPAAIPAVRASTLLISLIANFVGLDDHKSLLLPGAERTMMEEEVDQIGDQGGKATAHSGDGEAVGVTSKSIKHISSSSSSSTSSNLSGELEKEVSLHQKADSESEHCESEISVPPIDLNRGNLDQFRYKASIYNSNSKEQADGVNPSKMVKHRESTFSAKTPNSLNDNFERESTESPQAQKTLSKAWGNEKEYDGKSVLAKANPVSKGLEWNQLPQAGMFSRKASVGNRDIRDCLIANPLNTIRRKATEMNLLETVKSSKLSGQPYTSASPGQLAKKPRSSPSQTSSPNIADTDGVNVALDFDSLPGTSGKNFSQTPHTENRTPSAPHQGNSFFKRHAFESTALHHTPPELQSINTPRQQGQVQDQSEVPAQISAPFPRHRQTPLDSRSDYYRLQQVPAFTQQSQQAWHYPTEFRNISTLPGNPSNYPRNQGNQYRRLQNHQKNIDGPPLHDVNLPGYKSDVRNYPRPSGASASVSPSECMSKTQQNQMNATSNPIWPSKTSKPVEIPAHASGEPFRGGLLNYSQQIPRTVNLSGNDENLNQPIKLTPDTSNGISAKRPLSSHGPQYQTQQQRPTKARGTLDSRLLFDRELLSQANFDEFF